MLVGQRSSRDSTTWQWWATLALGPGSVNGATRLGGEIALWVTRDQWAFGVHDAGASRVVEPGDVYDLSVLVGRHPRLNSHLDFVAGVGPGISRGHSTTGAVLPTEVVLAASAQLNLNYRIVGIGLDAFIARGQSRSYYGVGLAVAAGWFR